MLTRRHSLDDWDFKHQKCDDHTALQAAALSAEQLGERIDSIQADFEDFEINYESKSLSTGFGPRAVQWVLETYQVEVGQVAMGVPGPNFIFKLGQLHGVRILNLEPEVVVNSARVRVRRLSETSVALRKGVDLHKSISLDGDRL